MRYSSIVGIVELVFIDSLAISFVGGDSIVRSSVETLSKNIVWGFVTMFEWRNNNIRGFCTKSVYCTTWIRFVPGKSF